MKSFKKFIQTLKEAGGQNPGKLEVHNLRLEEARSYAQEQFEINGLDLYEEIPDFDENFNNAKNKTRKGKTKRRDMPVIETEDVKMLQKRLESGVLDVKDPHAKDIDFLSREPFPEGMTREQAQKFLEAGLKKHDGESKDDIIKTNLTRISFNNLDPIQKQIYFDKSIDNVAKFGVDGTIDFLTNQSILVASNDYHIIDGHHRWFSGLIVGPNLKPEVLVIDLPIKTLLPFARSYSDAIGNDRNL